LLIAKTFVCDRPRLDWQRMTPVDNNQVVDRRRTVQASQSPREALEQLPALVLLERIPVPTLAVLQDGTIVFANKAFAEMVGRRRRRSLC
jgi:PAS domain-containing protein